MLIQLTGAVCISRPNREPSRLSSAQAQVAFARLVLERSRGTGREQLANTVWPHGLPDTWASALRSVVSRARAFLANGAEVPPELISASGRYVLKLSGEVLVDVEQAQQALERAHNALFEGELQAAERYAAGAVMCFRRPFLPAHDGEWVNGVREQLHESLVAALETAATAASRRGEGNAALPFAREAVRQAPLRESAYRCLMSAQLTAGNRGEALQVYNRLRSVLAEELGTDPSEETQAMYVDILGAPNGAARRDAPAVQAPLIGREGELEALRSELTAVAGGNGRLVLVSGEPGIGKTRLVSEAVRGFGADGGLVLWVRCGRRQEHPGQGLLDAIADWRSSTPVDSLPRGAAIAHAELAALVADSTEPHPDSLQRFTLHARNLLDELAREQPVALVLDHVEGPEPALHHLLVRLLGSAAPGSKRRLCILVTANLLALTSEWRKSLRALEREGRVQRIALPGLSATHCRQLARAACTPNAQPLDLRGQRLLEATGGNPFLLGVLARSTNESPCVQEYLQERLSPLEVTVRDFVTTSAVAGTEFESDLVGQVLGLAEPALHSVLDQLLLHGLIRECVAHPDRGTSLPCYRFVHSLLREALYEQLNPARRRLLHQQLGEAIESGRAVALDSYSAQVAHHYDVGLRLRDAHESVDIAWRAAEAALRDGAPDESIRLHKRTLDSIPAAHPELRAEALTRLGIAQLAIEDPACSQTLLDASLHAIHAGRYDTAVRAGTFLHDSFAVTGLLMEEFRAVSRLIIRRLSERREEEELCGVEVGRFLGRYLRVTGDNLPPRLVARSLSALTVRLEDLQGPGSQDERRVLALDAWLLAQHAGDGERGVLASHHLASAAAITGSSKDLRRAAHQIARLPKDDAAAAPVRLLIREYSAAEATMHGRFADVEELTAGTAGEGLIISPPPGSMLGPQRLVARWLAQHLGALPPAGSHDVLPGTSYALDCLAALMDGRRGEAHLTVRAAATGALEFPEGDAWLHFAGLLAICAVDLGDARTAAALSEQLQGARDLMCGHGYRTFVGPVSLHLGRLSRICGDWDEAEHCLSASLSVLNSLRARPWISLAQTELALVLEKRGRIGDKPTAAALHADARRLARPLRNS